MFVYKLFLFLFCRWVCLSSSNSWSSIREVGTLGDVILYKWGNTLRQIVSFDWGIHYISWNVCNFIASVLFCFGYVFSSGWVWMSGALNIFKCIFLNENVWNLIKISLKFVPKGLLHNIPVLVPIMSWHRPGAKPLSEPMIFSLPMRICTLCLNELTLNVRGPSYLGLTRSISWLPMPWLLTSPGHQQPWYWLCSICRSWSYLRKDFKYMCHVNVE